MSVGEKGEKGGNIWWKHRRFSILLEGHVCVRAADPRSTPMDLEQIFHEQQLQTVYPWQDTAYYRVYLYSCICKYMLNRAWPQSTFMLRQRWNASMNRGQWFLSTRHTPKVIQYNTIKAIQYNTTELWYWPSFRKCRSALALLGGADVVVLQSNCVRRTCSSRSLHEG